MTLAATRRNARHSTGPPAAKQNSKLNALKHGRYALPENHRQSRLCGMALGEGPEEFEWLKQKHFPAAKL
jgi:hypothetical protein